MQHQLLFYLYSSSYSSPVWKEEITDQVANVRLMWEIHGGIKTIELDLGLSWHDAWTWYSARHGQRLVVLDTMLDRPVAEGQIYGVGLAPWGARPVAMGPWQRLFDRLITDDPTDTDTTSDVLKSWLTTYASIVNSDQSNIAETSTQVGEWIPRDGGEYLGDIVAKFAAMSDSGNRQWNFWLRSAAMSGVLPQSPVAYYQPQGDDADIDWQFWREDLAPGGVELERSIFDLANNVVVRYSDEDGEQQVAAAASDSASQSEYWQRDVDESLGRATATPAEQYRNLYLSKFAQPILTQAFTLSAPFVLDGNGHQWPLWRVLANGGGYVRVNDLEPNTSLFSVSVDHAQTGQITTAEYDYRNNNLRLVLDTEDNRLDAILARAGLR